MYTMAMRASTSGTRSSAVVAVVATLFAGVFGMSLATDAVADPNCTCRGLGRNFELGETACLETPKGPRIATCGMVLNNTSWYFSDTPCVAARADPPAGDERAESEMRLSRLH
jgi:hypothetical protein